MGERRYLRIGVELERLGILDVGAAEAGIDVHQFASVLLQERIDEIVAARRWLRVVLALERLADAVSGASAFPTELSANSQVAGRGAADNQPKHRGRHSASSRSSSPGLHEEIMRVLKASGQPMTAEAIAEAIRDAGRYKAPRSQRPITAQTVNSRISHPGYRILFERSSGKVALPSRRRA